MNKFISFEGIDGSGKSLQIKYLKSKLQYLNPIFLREPGGTSISEQIRKIVLTNKNQEICYLTEALLYSASRAQLVCEVIKPALDNNKIVICDRYIDSSIVYQGIMRKLGVEKIQTINNFATNNLMPTITFLLDITVEVSQQRKNKRNNLDRIDNENLDFYKQSREAYLSLASKNKDRFVVLNAMQSPLQLHKAIIKILKNRKLI